MIRIRQIAFLIAAGLHPKYGICYIQKQQISSPIKCFSVGRHTVRIRNVDEPETPTLAPLGEISNIKENQSSYLFGPGDISSFKELDVNEPLCRALEVCGKSHPTTIQASCYTTILSGKDCLIGAETGSGKTLAYLLPIFQTILTCDFFGSIHYPSAIIMVTGKKYNNINDNNYK